ncbi:hypothetical protein QCE49_27790 [Caballeronia sp. LZ008]|uniref:hypothetical protein n=1 Tax=unclassified Caballeronia TaxID=2646786 RepID=UPI0020276F71|nr:MULTISPECIES: hypothetical protein [unclassified Caballeronia]MDR5797203.1 hypothetical protein [Caballeronia sp. LZ008]
MDDITAKDVRIIRRDGYNFVACIRGLDRPAFITGSALAVLRGDLKGDDMSVFNDRWNRIAIAVNRKHPITPADQEIFISSDDVSLGD